MTDSSICPTCGRPADPADEFCSWCGGPIAPPVVGAPTQPMPPGAQPMPPGAVPTQAMPPATAPGPEPGPPRATPAGGGWSPGLKIVVAVLAATVVGVGALLLIASLGDDGQPAVAPPATSVTPSVVLPTQAPQATDVTTPETVPDVEVCTNAEQNYQLSYPAGWYTESDDPTWQCALFDPAPFDLTVQAQIPDVVLTIVRVDGPYADNVGIVTDSPADEVLESLPGIAPAGRPATCALLESNGDALLEAGIVHQSCLVDWGDFGLLIDAVDWGGTDFDEAQTAMDLALDTIEPLTPLP